MTYNINRVAVIGAGTMGGGIAALIANAGLPVYLLDIAPTELTPDEAQKNLTVESPQVRNRVVKTLFDRLKKMKPAAFFNDEAAARVMVGNLADNFKWLEEADWIIEAVVEQLEPKKELIARVEQVRKPDSIVSSNTSGLPIASLATDAADDFKTHFLGTHFFNPPRYMKLLEVIPTPDTKPEIIEFITEFAERRLGKGVVICKDTPNFIANRYGSITAAMGLEYILKNGYTIEEADAIMGQVIGRPKTGIFRLQDLVGLDVSYGVGMNLYELIPYDETREVLREPGLSALRKSQMEKGRLGDKTGQGYYQKPARGGKENILSLDLQTLEYRPRIEPDLPTIGAALKIKDTGERLKFVLAQDDKVGALARHVVYHALAYAARRVPEITDDLVNVDRAVRWGFSHDLGPFELWDALGVRATASAMEEQGIAVAEWVKEMLDAGNESFYRADENGLSYYASAQNNYKTEPPDERQIKLAARKLTKHTIRENKGASLVDIGDGVLCLEFHTKLNTFDADVVEMLYHAADETESGAWQGLVIGNDAPDFSVGANLKLFSDVAALEGAVKATQDAMMRVRFCAKPVVVAPAGRTLGGGAEITLHAARIVMAGATYIGLPETSVGLIPGAGGCKEFVRRIISPAMRAAASADPLPFAQKVLQTIALAKVSTSAGEARDLGYLTDADRIVMNRDHLIYEAKQTVLDLAAEDYAPPARAAKNCYAAGRDIYAALCAGLYQMQQGAYISEYDYTVATQVAYIICGGDLSAPQWTDEQYFLDLEREAFIKLCREPKTQERIAHLLATGKPLRN